MSFSIKVTNERLNFKEQLKKQLLNAELWLKVGFMIILSSVSLTASFRLGIVFMLPLLSLVLKFDRKWGMLL